MTDHPVSRIRAWLLRSLRQDRRRGLELALRAAGEPVESVPAGTQGGADEQEPLEAAVEGHRQLLETVVNQMPAAVCLIRGSDLRLQLINPAYQAIAPGKQMLGKTLDELWPETGQDFAAICRRVLESGEPYHVADELNMVRRRPDGPLEPTYFTWSLHRVRLPGGEGWGLVNAAWETTAHKRTEDALRESELRFRQVVESLPHLVWTCRADGPCDYLSPQWIRYTGIPEQRQLGYGWLEQLHPEDRDRTIAAWRDTASRGEAFAIEFRIRRHDGAYRWFRTLAVPLRDDAGNIVKWFGSNTDVQDLREAEQSVRASEARLRQALEAGEVFTFEWDPASDVVLRSPNCRSILGWDADATRDTGEGFFAAIHPEDREAFVRTVTRLTPEHPAYVATYRYLRRGDGREVVLEETGRAAFSDTGTMVGLRGLTRDVTERKRAEEALRESAARLRLAQASAGAGIWDWDIGTGTLEWSEELFRLFGLDPATHQASFESWRAVIHPDDRRLAEHRIEAAVANHASLASEYRIVLPSGELRWISALGHATYDPDGAPRRMSGICIDISERMRVEETLRQSEERYRTLFESMAEGFALHELIVDDQGKPCDYRFLEVNPAFGRLTGLDPRTMVGRTVRQVIPTIEPSWIDTYGAVVRTGESVRFERYLAALDRWYEVFAYSPAPGRFATAFTDITARKGAEAALRQSREDLDRAQEVGQVGSWRLDVRRNVLTWSDESYRIFGAPAGTPQTYDSFLEAIHPDDREYVDAMWSAALRGEPYDIEHRIVVHGQVKWVREKAYLEFDEAGGLRGGFGITQDITDRKLAEQRLRESLAEKELLLREIHHRVKNNLQVVSSLVSLQADALTDPRFREVFNDVRNRVRSMGLVHEKLYQSGGLSRLDFADYAAGLTRSLWNVHGAVGARVKLQLEVEPVELPVATAVPCGLILNELVSNSLKHAFPSGGGTVTVGLAREPASGRIRLRVRDDGVGLAAGFDWRHARSLGLRLVQMLAAQLEGSVEAGTGPGTEFCVSFVAKEAEVGGAAAAGERSPRNDRRA